MRISYWLFCALIGVVLNQAYAAAESDLQILKTGWMIQSAEEVEATGEKISTAAFKTQGWYSTTVPSTVLSALVRAGVYRDVFFGRNMEKISPEPFQCAWWYRKEFDMHKPAASTRLIFDGINYSANIFVNGVRAASVDDIYGAFRRFDVDISRLVKPKGNVIAVQVFPPKAGDFTIGFVDWNPEPPDREMGLWREVKLRTSGPISIENPFVQSKLDLESFKEARVTITATIVNHTKNPVSGKIEGQLQGGAAFRQEISLNSDESKEIRFTADDSQALLVKNPRVWWPNNLGSPELYSLKLTLSDANGISDTQDVTFGIREVSDYTNDAGHRGYIVNGRKILIRGGGWVDDMLLNEDEKKLEAQIQYTKHLNLNTIRLEGFWGSSEKLYQLADKYGLLVMVGFSCQWEWKDYLGKEADEDFGGVTTKEDMDLVTAYLRDQVIWLRNHPSIFVWVLGSDKLPHPELEKREREDLARIDPTRPLLASCKTWNSEVSGPTAVKMNGPYEYVPPIYWYVDKENGGAFGFNTETGPGPQPPPAESIRRMFASEHFWPIDDTWNYHCGRHEFNTLDVYVKSFNSRYGEQESMEDFTKKAQAANYEAIRPMFEAFGIRRPVTTGIVQWMLNASWPKMYWQLYDYFLMPGGAFYGARKANQPLSIVYDYGDRSIHVLNETQNDQSSLSAVVKVLSMNSSELYSQTVNTAVASNETKQILQLPVVDAPVYFVSLKLQDSSGREVADNFYWLSAKQDVLDPEKVEWYYTPSKEYADFTALKDLPPADIQVEQHLLANGLSVTLKNPSSRVAFFIEMKIIRDRTGRSVLPVFWDDNYVSLLPGETKQLTARFSQQDLHGEKPLLKYSGWNVPGNE